MAARVAGGGRRGGLAYLVGLGAVAVAAFVPLRGAFGPRRPLVTRAYAVALACVATGVVLSTAYLAGVPAVVERWGLLKPAHAWLNVVGFLSLVIAATLVHLAPTVVGTRMRPRTSARIAVAGIALGAAVVALGLALAVDALVGLGALSTVVGALALTRHAGVVQRERGRWTTDPGWHRVSVMEPRPGAGLVRLAIALAGGRFVLGGADPAAWESAPSPRRSASVGSPRC